MDGQREGLRMSLWQLFLPCSTWWNQVISDWESVLVVVDEGGREGGRDEGPCVAFVVRSLKEGEGGAEGEKEE